MILIEAKGSCVEVIPIFVKEKYGEEAWQKLLDALSPESRAIFESDILTSNWYPMEPAMLEPTQKICELFSSGDSKAAWKLGRYSAYHALTGVYKLLVRMGTPSFIAKRASIVFPQYYRPTAMIAENISDTESIVRVTKFEGLTECMEYRIGGWMEQAIELCGCKNPKVTIKTSMAKGNDVTEYSCTWEK